MGGAIRLEGSTSGYSALQAPPVAGDQTFTFPEKGGTLFVAPAGSTLPGYQQGTWIPQIQSADGADVATNYSNQIGNFYRIGNSVTIGFTLNLIDSAGLDPSKTLAIGNIPYVSSISAVNGTYWSSSSIHANGLTEKSIVFVNMLIGKNDVRTNPIYYAGTGKVSDYGQLTYAELGVGSLIGNISYVTDDTTRMRVKKIK